MVQIIRKTSLPTADEVPGEHAPLPNKRLPSRFASLAQAGFRFCSPGTGN